MPKLVGTLNQRQITVAAAAFLQPQAGKLNYSFLPKIVSFIFCLDPPFLQSHQIYLYVMCIANYSFLVSRNVVI